MKRTSIFASAAVAVALIGASQTGAMAADRSPSPSSAAQATGQRSPNNPASVDNSKSSTTKDSKPGANQPSPDRSRAAALIAWEIAGRAEKAARSQVNEVFKAAIYGAQVEFDKAMGAAKTAAQKAAANAGRRAAVGAAIAARETALSAIVPAGPRP
ncbi:MAG: hypothetical protein WCK04_05075 [Actinomycetes bacterium]